MLSQPLLDGFLMEPAGEAHRHGVCRIGRPQVEVVGTLGDEHRKRGGAHVVQHSARGPRIQKAVAAKRTILNLLSEENITAKWWKGGGKWALSPNGDNKERHINYTLRRK